MWLSSTDTAQVSGVVTLEKLDGGKSVMSTTESAALNDYDNKKNVFHTFQGLISTEIQYPMAVIKGWFKIPKGKQWFGLGDRMVLNLHGQSGALQGCGFFLYKEQY